MPAPAVTTTLETDHGRFVCAEEGGGTEGTVVDGRPQGLATGTRESAGAWETFTVERDGEVCYLVSCGDEANGIASSYGCAEAEGTLGIFVFNRPSGGAWEALIPHEMPYDRVAFEVACRPGHYLCAEPDGRIVIRQPEWDGQPSDQPGGYESFTSSYDFFAPPPVADLPFPPTAVAQLQGRVARHGVPLHDATGARSYTACHFFEGFSAYTRDPARATAQLVAIAQAYPAIRFLDVVGWYSYWRGREVSPIAFTARDGYAVAATPDYYAQLVAFAQVLQRIGLKAHWTRGDLQLFGGFSGIERHILTVCELVRDHGLQDVIEIHEVVNEPPFNGVRLDDARRLGELMTTALPGTLVSHGAPGGTEEASELRAWAQGADVGSVHGLRPGSATDVLRHIYSVRREGFGAGTCVVQGEPFGPGTDVSGGRSDDVELLTLACAQSLITAQRWTYMSGWGVRWNGPIHTQPGFVEVATIAGWIPEDVFSWTLTRGGLVDNPFASASGYFGDSGVSHGPARVDAAYAGDGRYLVTVYGGRPPYVLRAQHRLTFDVINTTTRQVEQSGVLEAGQTVTLYDYRIGRLIAGRLR